MALKDGSSHGPDVRDLTTQLGAFQEVNRCTLMLYMGLKGGSLNPDLEIIVNAYTRPDAPAEPVLLASSHFSLKAQGFRTVDAAIMFAMYQIDFMLAEHELRPGIKG